MKILILDAYNLIHRARFGFGEGEHNIIFNFFRSLRPIVEQFNPDKVYFVTEGYPATNVNLLETYKSNREASSDDFRRQKRIIINIVKEYLPIEVVRHPEFEADDVINTLAHRHKNDSVTIVSSDSDFIQLYDTLDDITLWHPVKKKVVPSPGYDYVLWKSLRGDKTDNIPGIPGIGDKTAESLVKDPKKLARKLENDDFRLLQERNLALIQLQIVPEEELEITPSEKFCDWNKLREKFLGEFAFKSMTTDSVWKKFVTTFKNLNS